MRNESDKMNEEFKVLFNKYYKSVYRYLITLTKNTYTAEEITSETFLKAIENIDKYNPEYKFYTWLCTIAKNTYYSNLKKEKLNSYLDDNIKDNAKDIIDKIIDSESNIAILKELHNLSEPYKEVFTLRVFGELSFLQIGEIFHKSEVWARVTYHRSKLKLKEKLK